MDELIRMHVALDIRGQYLLLEDLPDGDIHTRSLENLTVLVAALETASKSASPRALFFLRLLEGTPPALHACGIGTARVQDWDPRGQVIEPLAFAAA